MRITLPAPKRFSKVFQAATDISLLNPVSGICTDSRECMDGDLFIAIKGNNIDGQKFIHNAMDAGAVAALVAESDKTITGIQQVEVDNPVNTIGIVANAWRKQFNIPVIGITGTNGKTTTKDLAKHILDSKFQVHATKGNFNTSIGVPLTLLLIQNSHNYSVVELGASKPGEINTLCKISEPTDGLITNVAPAHLEGFGSVEKVAQEKSELFSYLSDGIAFKNVSDKWINSFTTKANLITYGFNTSCDYNANYQRESDGTIILSINDSKINTNSHNIVFCKNILAAAAIANSFDIDFNTIQERILSFSPSYGRSNIRKYDKITIIDDTYNANYISTISAIEYLAIYPTKGRRIFVFGDMAELGTASNTYHQKVGKKCIENKLDAVFTVGTKTNFTDDVLDNTIYHKHFSSKEELLQDLINFVQDDDIILFKGSRSMEMEKIIQKVFKK